ncbi:MAG: transposase [Hydrogeniiclostridium sp.]
MYNEEFKKQLVKEYIQGKPFSAITAECGVAKSTLSGWVKKYNKKCRILHLNVPNAPTYNLT